MNLKIEEPIDCGSFILVDEITLTSTTGISDIVLTTIENLKNRDNDHLLKQLTPIFRAESQKYNTTLLPGVFRKMVTERLPASYERNLYSKFIRLYPVFNNKQPLSILSIIKLNEFQIL